MVFQTAVSTTMAPGIEGGWTGHNPHFTLTNPDDGQWVVGAGTTLTPGAIIGRFGWANPLTGQITAAHPGVSNAVVGFIHRDQEAFITGLLQSASLLLVAGQPIDALEDGPVWGRFAAGATYNQKVYASYADGSLRAAAAASPATATGVTATTVSGSPNLTVVAGGTLLPGQPVSGTNIPAGNFIVSVSGTTAVMGNAAGGTSANATGSASGTAVTQTLDFETNWRARSTCLSGEIAKISIRG